MWLDPPTEREAAEYRARLTERAIWPRWRRALAEMRELMSFVATFAGIIAFIAILRVVVSLLGV